MLNRASRHEDFPLSRSSTCLACICKVLRWKTAQRLEGSGINETLFGGVDAESQENYSIQPSEFELCLGSSRTNATRIADELENG